MSDFQDFMARLCAFNRMAFGPGERRLGVAEHIEQELEEIRKASTSTERAAEWVDVAILGMDGLLRATREHLREQLDQFTEVEMLTDKELGGTDATLIVARFGEPTNDFVAKCALRALVIKRDKNELRDWDDWREVGDDHAVNHKEGSHD